MRIAIPHSLPRDEVRRRIRERSGELNDLVPGGMGTVETDWRNEDTLGLTVIAMGQRIEGSITVADSEMIVEFDLPGQLGFIGGMIEQKIREKGQKLLL